MGFDERLNVVGETQGRLKNGLKIKNIERKAGWGKVMSFFGHVKLRGPVDSWI